MLSQKPAHISRSALPKAFFAGWHLLCLSGFQLIVLRRANLLLGADYGDFAHPFALATFAAALTLMGLSQTLMRFLAVQTRDDAFDAVRHTLLRALAIRLTLVFVTAAGLTAYLMAEGRLSGETVSALVAFFAAQGLYLLFAAALQGMDRFDGLAFGSTALLLAALAPLSELSGLFWVLALGYGLGAAVYVLVIASTVRRGKSAGHEAPPLSELVRFSLVLSVGALFVLSSDNGPILLLREHYEAAVYGALALSFQLCLYPARLNAISEGLILPTMSAAVGIGDRGEARRLFSQWSSYLRNGGIVLLALLILALPLILRFAFGVEDPATAAFSALLMVAVLPRFSIPASSAVLIAHGRPGLLMTLSGLKLALDLLIVLTLAGSSPSLLLVAWVISATAYGQGIYLVAGKLLGRPTRLDGWQLLAVAVGLGALLGGQELLVLSVGALAAATVLLLGLRRPRRAEA